MKKIISFIPNLLTLGNLFCGCLAVLVISGFLQLRTDFIGEGFTLYPPVGDDYMDDTIVTIKKGILAFVTTLTIISLVLDLLDGLVARLLKVDSDLGKQLDSLADVVSFGVVPGLLLVVAPSQTFDFLGAETIMEWQASKIQYHFIGFVIPLAAAYRLAKFNIDESQSSIFRGLATPAMTLFIYGFVWLTLKFPHKELVSDPVIVAAIAILASFLMVSNIPMFSFKMKSFGWKENWFRYLLLLLSIPLLIWLQIGAFALIIPIYILLSLLARKSFVQDHS